MAEGLRSGFATFLAGGRGTFRPNLIALALLFTSGLLLQTTSAQVPPAQAKKAPQGNSAPPADAPPPPPAQIWLPPLQNPEHAPVIEWDGKLLTIDAENSSLSDVMLGIRSRTGASIDMPASANRERIAVHLGPAPIREVLSSLLYGTDFNYVIQSTEDDDTALGKVILIPRDDSSQGQDSVADEGQSKPKMRLAPRYAAPGKRDFEVAHARAATEDSSSPAADTSVAETPAADASANPDQPAATTVDSASANTSTDAQPATSESADSSSPADTNNTLTASGQSLSSATPAMSTGGSSTAGGTPTTIGEMEQNLQNMYKQRQQLQAQQNRPAAPQPNTP